MSSRALRKLQKEQEIEKQLALAKAAEEEYEEEVTANTAHSSKPINAFDMLEEAGAEEEEPDDEGEDDLNPPQATSQTIPSPTTPTPSKGKKKKKSKKKAKSKAVEPVTKGAEDEDEDEVEDEVDRALKELAIKNVARSTAADKTETKQHEDDWEAHVTGLLGIDTKRLNPVNEMKSLFGNIALETSESRATPPQRRREQNQQGGVDLGTALTGRYSPASKGKELGGLAKRRNPFMQGKEEWPLATSGGLSMEHLPDGHSFEKRYAIIHNNTYKDTQHQFRLCVESMDPQNLIQLLTLNPYHIATLLQVSEIARHQGDHSVSGDLLERALFSFGRSVHSTFPMALREGKARLSYDNPNNRELYLSIWRYIRNLEMRGTWKTAFEWTKLLLQLDTRSDPCGATMMIDQLALRGRQHRAFIEMCSQDAYGRDWFHIPNIQISLALAYQRASEPKLARRTLAVAMHKYPFMMSALATALDMSPLPKFLWAKLPNTDAEKLYTEFYTTRAKDLWNTPEATSLISEVAETLDHYADLIKSTPDARLIEISLEEARHIMLLEVPSLIALLPRKFTTMPTSSSDVLPPPSSSSNFTARAPISANRTTSLMEYFANALGAGAGATGSNTNPAAPGAGNSGPLSRLLSWFSSPAGPNSVAEPTDADRQAALQEFGDRMGGMPPDIAGDLLNDMVRMQHNTAATAPGDETHWGGTDMGDFDYYEDVINRPTEDEYAEAEEEEEDDGDSMPDLDSLSGNEAQLANHAPRQATVEDDPDERASHTHDAAHDGPILRHVNDLDQTHHFTRRPTVPEAIDATYPAQQFTSQPPTASTSQAQAQEPDPNPDSTFTPTDPQRIQRWLISTGLDTLRADPSALQIYVTRLRMLPKSQQGWILNIIRQRAGQDMVGRVRGALQGWDG